jgi:excinuclease UvrABC ATPase subunit
MEKETLEEPCVQCCGTGEIQKSTNRKQSNFECDICNGRGYWDKVIEPKQETLEEVAERLAYDSTEENKGFPSIKRFIEGAKFQQKRSYSEEEVMNILYKHTGYLFGENKHLLLEEWFEQFKKK